MAPELLKFYFGSIESWHFIFVQSETWLSEFVQWGSISFVFQNNVSVAKLMQT
jgi:hypothetical protein